MTEPPASPGASITTLSVSCSISYLEKHHILQTRGQELYWRAELSKYSYRSGGHFYS